MTPKQWYEQTIGKSFDTDGAYGAQCWDYFDAFCRKIGFSGSRYCGNTGYVGDLWILRDVSGYDYSTAFDYIYDPAQFQTGDWVFWEKHVAMYYEGLEVGQNQNGKPYVTAKEMNWSGILGAMRWRGWKIYQIPYGYSTVNINGHEYTLRRMTGSDKIGVISAGLNKVMPFEDLDADVQINAKIAGANFFQNDPDNPAGQPFGMTFGDLSAPLNGVYQSLPMQDSTLFYDLETGLFGDCTDVEVNSSHNVFSPSLVFPNSKGNWEYARMVGLGWKDRKSNYTFLIRFADGYTVGLAMQEMTPAEIASDFSETEMVNISFLDGGGSAQAAFWHDGGMDYARKTPRNIPSAIAIYREGVSAPPTSDETQPEPPQEPDPLPETPPAEGENMTEKDPEVIIKDPNWKDPDTIDPTLNPWKVILLNIANLFKVKSILTFALTGAYIALLFSNIEIPKFLETILTMVIGFYYGTQFEKTGDKK